MNDEDEDDFEPPKKRRRFADPASARALESARKEFVPRNTNLFVEWMKDRNK